MKWNKNHMLILLLVGILLVVISIPTKQTDTFGEGGTDEEERLERLLSQMEGVGEVGVMITYQEKDEVEGIAVISSQADNSIVVKNITEVIQALFNVETHKIKVIKGNETN